MAATQVKSLFSRTLRRPTGQLELECPRVFDGVPSLWVEWELKLVYQNKVRSLPGTAAASGCGPVGLSLPMSLGLAWTMRPLAQPWVARGQLGNLRLGGTVNLGQTASAAQIPGNFAAAWASRARGAALGLLVSKAGCSVELRRACAAAFASGPVLGARGRELRACAACGAPLQTPPPPPTHPPPRDRRLVAPMMGSLGERRLWA
jgi:hypothetical protein